MIGPTTFEPNPISGLSVNAWKLLQQSDARKRRESIGAQPKANQA